jgi:hypothetical protein
MDDKSGVVNSSTIILNCYKIVHCVSAFEIASSCGNNEVIHRLGYVCCSILVLYLCALLPSLNRRKLYCVSVVWCFCRR